MDGQLRSYVADAARRPMLDAAAERELMRGWADPRQREAIRETLVEGSLRFAMAVAIQEHRRRGMTIPIQDAVAEANVGLVEAANRFDPGKGVRFISYAVWWVKQRVGAACDSAHPLVYPQNVLNEFGRVGLAEKVLFQRLGRQPTDDEVAAEADITLRRLDNVRVHGPAHCLRADGTPYDDETDVQWWDVLEDRGAEMPDEAVQHKEAEALWDNIGQTLDARERDIFGRHNGLTGEPETLDAIGADYGVSRERVRQIEVRARERLQRRHPQLREALV
jgi:RNA polymerase primary sigma factor